MEQPIFVFVSLVRGTDFSPAPRVTECGRKGGGERTEPRVQGGALRVRGVRLRLRVESRGGRKVRRCRVWNPRVVEDLRQEGFRSEREPHPLHPQTL